MSYIEKTISMYGTELQFLQAFISAITAADNRITCLTNNLETQFADTSNTPTFTLSVDGIYTITFTRGRALSDDNYAYRVSSSVFNNNPLYLDLSYSSYEYYNAKTIRKWRFSVVANSEDIYLKLASWDGNLNSPIAKWLSIKNNAISIYAVQRNNSTNNIMSSDFKTIGGQEYTKVDRLLYTYNSSDSTKIELIKSKMFVEKGTTNRAFEISKIIDSTTVTAGRDISINSTRYYVLDSHTLMEIE